MGMIAPKPIDAGGRWVPRSINCVPRLEPQAFADSRAIASLLNPAPQLDLVMPMAPFRLPHFEIMPRRANAVRNDLAD